MTDLIEEIMQQKKFSPLQGEEVLIDGLTSYIKSAVNLISGHAYLTNHRLIFCRKMLLTGMALFGGAGFGYSLGRKQTRITFQIPLSEIKLIKKGKYGFSSKYTVETNTGKKYNVQFSDEDKWVEILISHSVNCIE
jgi:hypothetical protein